MDIPSDWVVVEHQHQRLQHRLGLQLDSKQSPPSISPTTKPLELLISDYFDPPLNEANPFRVPAPQSQSPPSQQQLTLSSPSNANNINTSTNNLSPTDQVSEVHTIIKHLLVNVSCRGCHSSPCSCLTSPDEITQSLRRLAVLVEQHPTLLEDIQQHAHHHPDHHSITPQHQHQHQHMDLANSVILIPEASKLPSPTNLDSMFRPENINRVSSAVTSLVHSASRTRDNLNTKSSNLLQSLPCSSALHVLLGLLVVYFALPNSAGLLVVRRIFDVVVVRNVVLASSWSLLSQYLDTLDDSAGQRSSLVPV